MPDIMHLITIRASPERVYDDGNWWTRDADLDGEVGGTGEFRFSY